MANTQTATTVIVRDLSIDAMIGVDADEQGRSRPLIVTVTANVDMAPAPAVLADTLDHCAIVAAARDLASRPIGLIEDFARLLAERCLELGPVRCVTVDIAKPGAITGGMAATSVTVERVSGTRVVPFPRAARGGLQQLRFRFEPDINPDAQRKLSWLLNELAGSIYGVDLSALTYDPGAAEWTASVTLGDRRAPRLTAIVEDCSPRCCQTKASSSLHDGVRSLKAGV
ncbi:MAG: dihydroneopterin aldolase [Sphingomonas sp.]|uniref:dihydroneopterin aldolase n=1 Tax=Sphingomonas sp. TaxID=28214 RepID=UPI001AC9A176|nr:dihydroneopterin aldolase [Sphingomonas sp.]MBN8816262.1 dihydroneopterin aldolase [Sphingomonas sp.]